MVFDQNMTKGRSFMKTAGKVLWVLIGLAAVSTLSGCTNWEKKYKSLDVEYQNLKGLYENCQATLDSSAAEKSRMGQELANSKKQLEDMQKQIQEKKVSPGKATGFEGMDVAVDAAAGTITVTVSDSILFASGSSTLKNTYIAELDKIYGVIRERYSGRKIDIVGHTDSDPIKKSKWKDNWELSAQRALTVVRYMVDKGISKERIRAIGCGDAQSVASNSSSAGKSKNRRVEVVVHMK
jgi:chemotaxis protein MotB